MMQANASANMHCSKFGDVVNVSNDAHTPIPVVDQHELFDGVLLEDLEIIFHEIAINRSLLSSPSTISQVDEETYRPRASRDLGVHVPTEKREKHLVKKSTERPGLRERLESYLDVEHGNQEVGCKTAAACDKENGNATSTNGNKHKRYRSQQSKSTRHCKKVKKDMYLPVVWVIQPGHNKDGTIWFKFTTDGGAYLVLKDEEALASLDIMKASSPSTTYFQVYSLHGSSSRVMKPDRVAQAVNDIIAEAKPIPEERDLVTFRPTTSRHGLRRGFHRFMLRRRWQRVVRRQIRIAVGDTRECSGFAYLTSPLAKFWKRVCRRNRKSRI